MIIGARHHAVARRKDFSVTGRRRANPIGAHPGPSRSLGLADPAHHRPEPAADLLHRMLHVLGVVALIVRQTAVVLGDPLTGERAVLDLLEDLPHLSPGGIGDDAGTPGVPA